MVFAIFYILRKNFRTSYFLHKEDIKQGEEIRIVLSEEVTFLNKASIQLMLDELPEDSSVIIDGSRSVNIDYDVLEIIHNFRLHNAPDRNIQLTLINVPDVTLSSGH